MRFWRDDTGFLPTQERRGAPGAFLALRWHMHSVTGIGAGPVGATFALLAARQGIAVTLLEAREGPSRETRTLALSHGSRVILESCDVWGGHLRATEIHSIHTSQRGGFGRMLLTREDAGVPALGYVLAYADLQAALDAQLASKDIPVLRGAVVSAFDDSEQQVQVKFTHAGSEVTQRADAVILADGGANLDKVPAFQIDEKDYQQQALLGHVTTDTAHAGRAFERFTSDGPAALLPLGGAHDYSMVWVASPSRIAALTALEEPAFLAAFQAHFGHRAGRFLSIANRRSFPLKLRTVSARVSGRIAVIGNAAQALHPVAGQGFNLGLRDAAMLAQQLVTDSGTATEILRAYDGARARDVDRSVGFTDFLVSAFASDHLLARVPRGLGLAAMDMLPFARRALARRMMFGAAK